MSNPFFTLQQRVHDLIAAQSYFVALAPNQILTEQVADLDNRIQTVLLQLGFGIVVMTAEGVPATSADFGVVVSLERLTVSIVHNPTLDMTHNALDALDAVRQAVIGQSVQPTPPDADKAWDYFGYAGHQRRMDSLPELNVHELHITAGLRLQ